MNTYLAIITTVLVLTQIVRIVQNTVNLHRQNKIIKAQLDGLEDVNNEDIKRRREVDMLLVQFLKNQLDENEGNLEE